MSDNAFHVARWVDALGGSVNRHKKFWIWLGNLESRLLSDEIAAVEAEQPIYVSGLARSGSTILLEILAKHDQAATHRYKDYPPVFTPLLWNRLLERMPMRRTEAAERTHGDGIEVTPESPEAFEEAIWMAFFPDLHDSSSASVLDHQTSHPPFEQFYRDHIRKLLHTRGGRRYVSKANYNVTRLEYLLKMFPDARFILPVREPAWHIASLMKQHALFCDGERRNPRALEHMRRVGHFEFGLDRRPVDAGNQERLADVTDAWERGAEVEGWARYWSLVYDYVADRVEANPTLRAAALVVRFEDLCETPREILGRVLDHCRLPDANSIVDEGARAIRFPSYYAPEFTEDELTVIHRETRRTAQRFGYDRFVASAGADDCKPFRNGTARARATDTSENAAARVNE